MTITINIECEEQFAEWAKKKGVSVQQLAQDIFNNYCNCLHKLQYEEYEKAYEELSRENA